MKFSRFPRPSGRKGRKARISAPGRREFCCLRREDFAVQWYDKAETPELTGEEGPRLTQTDLPGEVLAMTGRAADRLLKLDIGDAALAYLSLLRRGELPGGSRARLDAALEQLRKAGLAPAQRT